MKRIAVTDKRALGKIIPRRPTQDILVERGGHAIALIVPFSDDDFEWYRRERDPAFIKSIARARRQVRQGKTIPLEKLKSQLGIK